MFYLGNRSHRAARPGLLRSRWAAIGAAVAVTFGGGGLFVANAVSSPSSSVVTIDPVRILDTRTDVGLPGPFVSATSQKLQVTGGAVPAGATGVLLNVTVVAPSANGFLSVRPGDATGAPSTSSLNFVAGDILPNSVQVGLPTTGANVGQIDITYDAFGRPGPTTEVLVDVVGYMIAGGAGSGPVGPAGPAGPVGPVGPSSVHGTVIIPINYRSAGPAEGPLAQLNGISIYFDCSPAGEETIKVSTNVSGGEISSMSTDSSAGPQYAPYGTIDDNFSAGDVLVAGPGAGNSATDRQYTIAYSAPDGRNVVVDLMTEDAIGGNNCIVSGFVMGAP